MREYPKQLFKGTPEEHEEAIGKGKKPQVLIAKDADQEATATAAGWRTDLHENAAPKGNPVVDDPQADLDAGKKLAPVKPAAKGKK